MKKFLVYLKPQPMTDNSKEELMETLNRLGILDKVDHVKEVGINDEKEI